MEIEAPGNTTDPSAVMDVLAFSNEASGSERSTPAFVSKEHFGRVRDNFLKSGFTYNRSWTGRVFGG